MGLLDPPALTRARALKTFTKLWNSSKIVAIGDSWTAGNQDGTGTTYPALLATALPWATVTNLGNSGWTSTEIAALWGAPFTLGAFTTATDTTTLTSVSITAPTTAYRTSSSITFNWVGELRLANGAVIPGTLQHVASSATWSDGWSFKRGVAGAAVAVSAGSTFVCTQYDSLKDATLIIEVGLNNFGPVEAPATIVRDVNAILAARSASGAPYLVLAVPTASAEPAGTVPYARKQRVNAALKTAFPNAYTDHRRYMIDRGLAVTGTAVTSADSGQIIGDTLPQSLLFASAYDHPKAVGYKAIAACVIDGLSRVGALANASSGVSGVTTTALGQMSWTPSSSEPLGSSVNNALDRSSTTVIQAPDTASAPTLMSIDGQRVWRFDGVDDRLWTFVGSLPQPFTVIAKLTVRDFKSQAVGVFWTYDTPGATLSIATSGRVVLDAGASLQTPQLQVATGVPVTIAAVANGASSAVGLVGSLTTGDAGTRGIVTQGQIGRYTTGGVNYPSAIDVASIFVAPWAMSDAQITALTSQNVVTVKDNDVLYARPQRNVMARGNLIDQRSDGVITSQTTRIRSVIRGGAVMVRLVYANWYLPSGSAEQPMGNDYTVKASIENPSVNGGRPTGDVVIPVFFGGKRTATVENNGIAVSDPVLINAPIDWAVFVRSLVTVTSGGRFPTNYASSTAGTAQPDTSGVAEGFVNDTDSVDSGTISAATGFAFGPVAILTDAINDVHTHGALIIGDSIARGTGIVTPTGSFLAQGCINQGIPIFRIAVGGDSFAFSKSPANVYRRMALARYARHALINMGTNDVFTSSSLATLKADAIAFWHLMADQGLKVHQATILPRPGASTDGYLTASNQSIVNSSFETVRTGFNTWLRSGQAIIDAVGALSSVIDSAALIEVNSSNVLTLNGGFWKAGGPVSLTGTATGITSTTLTDSTKSWTTNQFQNQVLLITSATTGAGQIARITSNNGTVLSLSPAFSPTPTGTVTYQIAPANCWDHTHPTETAYALITSGLNLSYLKTT